MHDRSPNVVERVLSFVGHLLPGLIADRMPDKDLRDVLRIKNLCLISSLGDETGRDDRAARKTRTLKRSRVVHDAGRA